MKRFWFVILLLVIVCMSFAGTTGKLAGKVKDENGKGLAYANVTVLLGSGRITGIQTKENGSYIMINIPPGEYEVKYQLQSYAELIVSGVIIKVDQTTTQNVVLQKKSISMDTVRVTAKELKANKDQTGSERKMDTQAMMLPPEERGKLMAPTSSGGRANDVSISLDAMLVSDPNGAHYIDKEGKVRHDYYEPCRYIHNYMPPPPPKVNYNTEDYAQVIENDYLYSRAEPLSTFSIDVDTACYSNIRRMIENRQLPEKGYVRIEELLNYFKYDYPRPKGNEPFAVYTELGSCPWNRDHQLLHIGLKAKDVDMQEAPPSNLVFLLDVSGSMDNYKKLPLVKESMKLLVKQMRSQDIISIVTYASNARVHMPATHGNNKTSIMETIDKLRAGGSTAGGAGIEMAYHIASDNYIRKGNNRVIMCTDGDFNTGDYSNEAMEKLITEKRNKGIFLTVLGYGMGNIKDSKMEILADKGNGNYAYIDNLIEAQRVLVKEMGGTLLTVSKDVKLQLEFNPAKVKAYRLIGYENRILNKEDFNDDSKDAGELGAGHTVTALYELIPAGSDERIKDVDPLKYQKVQLTDEAKNNNELLTIKLRYKEPDSRESKLMTKVIKHNLIPRSETSDNFRFSAAVAEYGLLLKDSAYKGNAYWGQVLDLARNARGNDEDGYRKEFVSLSEMARDLMKPNPHYDDDYRNDRD